jgi:hypothetical protein
MNEVESKFEQQVTNRILNTYYNVSELRVVLFLFLLKIKIYFTLKKK